MVHGANMGHEHKYEYENTNPPNTEPNTPNTNTEHWQTTLRHCTGDVRCWCLACGRAAQSTDSSFACSATSEAPLFGAEATLVAVGKSPSCATQATGKCARGPELALVLAPPVTAARVRGVTRTRTAFGAWGLPVDESERTGMPVAFPEAWAWRRRRRRRRMKKTAAAIAARPPATLRPITTPEGRRPLRSSHPSSSPPRPPL